MSEAAFAAAPAFVAGLSARHDAAAVHLRRVFAERPAGFAPGDLIARIEEAFCTTEAGPKGYAPADARAAPAPVEVPVPDVPVVDPIAEARRQGYEDGLAVARAEREEAAHRDRALLEDVVAALKSDDRVDRGRIAHQLRQTVLHLVTRLVGDVGVSGDLLGARVDAAAELLADASESAMLRVNPADVALLDGRLPPTIFAVGDASQLRGSFVLEAASTIVEDGPELWLEQLTHALDKIAVPG